MAADLANDISLAALWQYLQLNYPAQSGDLYITGPILYAALNHDRPLYYLLHYIQHIHLINNYTLTDKMDVTVEPGCTLMTGLLQSLNVNSLEHLYDISHCEEGNNLYLNNLLPLNYVFENKDWSRIYKIHKYICAWEWLYLHTVALPERNKLIMELYNTSSIVIDVQDYVMPDVSLAPDIILLEVLKYNNTQRNLQLPSSAKADDINITIIAKWLAEKKKHKEILASYMDNINNLVLYIRETWLNKVHIRRELSASTLQITPL